MNRSRQILKLALEQARRNECENNNTNIIDEDADNNSDPFSAASEGDPEYLLSESESNNTSVSAEPTHTLVEVSEHLPGAVECAQQARQKRRSDELWKQNVRKRKRNSGQEYINTKNIKIEARKPKTACHNCVYKCTNSIDAQARQLICDEFWKIGDLQRQRDYIVTRIICSESVRTRVEKSRRKFSHQYYLFYLNKKHRVCKKFFLATLDVSEKMMRTALLKSERSIVNVPSPDCRGKHPPGIKIPDDVMKLTDEHIASFPTVPAHWCRKDSRKTYLESILNKEKMYSLYLEFCTEKNIKPVSKTLYREMLIKKNIGFYHPKKDQCWCYEYEQKTEDFKVEKREEFDLHKKRKDAANLAKKEDGERAKRDETFLTANFDLEAVLYCPLFYAKPLFYKRKLAVYNFTIYEVASKKGTCFLWDECAGKRGANEIATCLSMYIDKLPPNVKHVSLFSDNCPGQNRNTVVAFMLSFCLSRSALESIEIKFLEAGHTHMECDSIHATIEAASKNAKILVPSDWYNVIRLAKKRGEPYDIYKLKYTDFKDFKRYKESAMINCHKDKDNDTLSWKNVRCIKFLKNTPDILYYKNEYWDSEYKQLDMQYRAKGGRRRQVSDSNEVPILYHAALKIDPKKYKNLMELCKMDIIPTEHHNYYKSLNVSEDNGDDSSDDEISLQTRRERS